MIKIYKFIILKFWIKNNNNFLYVDQANTY